MKKRWQALLCLFLYIILIAIVMNFDIRKLVDIRDIMALLAGSLLLALPFFHRTMKKEEFFLLYEKKAIEAGLIQTFLLLFIRLSDKKGYTEVLQDMALCFRPVLYGLCIRVIFTREETQRIEVQREEEKEGLLYNNKGAHEISFEDCIAVGLTQREAQIALMICRRCSNREIAEELVISEMTVKKHVSNIFEKTGIRRREELQEALFSLYRK